MSASARRVRFGVMTAILLIAATASLLIANALARRYPARIDATSTREHRLSPRSAAVVSGLSGEYEVVVAAPIRDARLIDRRIADRVLDVLERFKDATGGKGGANLRTTVIDTGSPTGMEEFDALLARLSERDKAKAAAQAQTIQAACERAQGLAAWMEAAAPRLQAIRDALPTDTPAASTNRAYFEQRATEFRVNARALRELADKALEASQQSPPPLNLPNVEAATDLLLTPLGDLYGGLNDIAENGRRFAESETMPREARDLARTLVPDVAARRDQLGVMRDALERLPRLDTFRISKALGAASVAMVIGPPERGLVGIDLPRLLPPPATIEAGQQADAGRNAEELIATALSSLASPDRPIVVFVHGQGVRGFLRSQDFAALLDQLSLRGIDAAEWAAAVDAEPPSLTRLDPAGRRPVVFVVLSTDSASNPGARGQSGPERAAKLGGMVREIIGAGQPVLLSLNPSTLPTFGEADPMVAVLPEFGLGADTGRPLLRERFTAGGRLVDAYATLTVVEGDHPVTAAVKGLLTRLEWPVALTTAERPGVKTWALYRIDDKAAWAESQWLGYWQVRQADHERVPDKPARDSQRDSADGPWVVAAAAERKTPDGETQRLIAVGSNTWFADRIAQERALVDGRPAAIFPGNAELFEASVYWLAGQDNMIAPTAAGRAAPLIRPLGPEALLMLRWLVIAGLPVLVLLTGLAWRLMRR